MNVSLFSISPPMQWDIIAYPVLLNETTFKSMMMLNIMITASYY